MRTAIFKLDAFASEVFAGNPAAVMPMKSFPAEATMQAIAAENNLSETAFLVPEDGDYRLRWFTPKVEVPLCGHATLASAAVVMERLEPRPGTRGLPHGQRALGDNPHECRLRHEFSGAALRATLAAGWAGRWIADHAFGSARQQL
jgi:hypothetical protein